MAGSLVRFGLILAVAFQSQINGSDQEHDGKKAGAKSDTSNRALIDRNTPRLRRPGRVIVRPERDRGRPTLKVLRVRSDDSDATPKPVSKPGHVIVPAEKSVRQLDASAAQVHVKLAIVELTLDSKSEPQSKDDSITSAGDIEQAIAALKRQGQLRVVARPELLAQDNQPAFVQIGERVPKIVGTTVSSHGKINSLQMENVGTMLHVTSRVVDNRIVTLDIDLEHSHVGPQDEGTPVATSSSGVVVRSPRFTTITIQTTVSVEPGKTILLGGMVHKTDKFHRKTVVLLQSKIVHSVR